MTNPLELQPLLDDEPEIVMRGVLSVLQGKKFDGKLSQQTIDDFRKLVSVCAGPKAQTAKLGKGVQQSATDKCIVRNAAFIAADKGLITKEDFAKRIKDLGLDDLAKEVGGMVAEVKKKIEAKEADDILGLFEE